jgi:hypothetical protein
MAQVKLETLTEYTAIDDSTYKAGQQLTFNKGKIDGYFFYIYDAVFSYKKEIERKDESIPAVLFHPYVFYVHLNHF